MLLLLVYVGGALAFSFLCSILEAALLSVRVVELEERKSRGDQAASRLLNFKQERIDDSISAILILNTVAHTAGAAAAGAQAAKIFGEQWVGVFSAVLIFLVLICTEIIPKTLGTVHASRLVGFVARTLEILIWILKPLLVATHFLTGFLARHEKKPISRGELAAMVALATREGTLEKADSRVLSNVLKYHDIRVEDVMTPRTVVFMLPLETTIEGFLAEEKCRVYSRIPLFEGTRDRPVGYVLQRDVLAAAARDEDPHTTLERFLRKAIFIPESLSVDRALRRLSEGREHLALVVDEFGGLAGLVSLEDLMETLLGIEIVDELDAVADLRAEAVRRRDQRLAGVAAPADG